VLLVHHVRPFWQNKDAGAWSIPKGEYDNDEEALIAATREFAEETGNTINVSKAIALQPIRQKSGKVVSAWAVEADIEPTFIASNTFEMEWPPRSGKRQSFPEVDDARWFTLEEALVMINPAQAALLYQVVEILR